MVPEQIIVANDFSLSSQAAMAIAASVAKRFGIKVVVLHVFEEVPHHRYQIPVSWMIAAIRKDIEHQLAEQVNTLSKSGIAAEGKILDKGFASTEILKIAYAHPNCLLVMGTHARFGVERFVLGSTAEEVLRQASCPVITVGPHVMRTLKNGALRRLLFATDFSKASMASVPLSDLFWRSGYEDLSVLHVSTEPNFRSSPESNAFEAFRILFGITGDSAHPAVDYVTLHGHDISQAIVNEAERRQTDLIVMGVQRGAACTPRLAPKIAYQVIAAAPCAVLTVSSDR